MLAKVIIENDVKKIQALTADAGAGNPVGTVIVVCSNQIPSNYLPLGTQYDTSLYPVLYALLGTDTTPTASALGLPTLTSGQYAIKATSGLSENAQDNVINTLNEQRSYSTEEVNTGKKWIDGKDIYSKVIEATLPSSGSGGSLKDLSALHIDYVTNLIAVIYNTTDDYIVMNGGYHFDTDDMTLFFRKTNGILYFYRNNANFSKNAPIKITLEYTKTTD
jgi:hypothetical protein